MPIQPATLSECLHQVSHKTVGSQCSFCHSQPTTGMCSLVGSQCRLFIEMNIRVSRKYILYSVSTEQTIWLLPVQKQKWCTVLCSSDLLQDVHVHVICQICKQIFVQVYHSVQVHNKMHQSSWQPCLHNRSDATWVRKKKRNHFQDALWLWVQLNLRTKDTLGTGLLSFLQRLSLFWRFAVLWFYIIPRMANWVDW